MAARVNQRQHKESVEHTFRVNTFKIIDEMEKVRTENQAEIKPLFDEMLHSIFFLGNICGNLSPKDIFPDEEIYNNLTEVYPRPFQQYQTHLPRRSPFSCVLDMIVLQEGQENEEQIKQSLQDLVNGLDPGFLVSSTICISQKSNNSTRYYGVSMSTTGPNAGKIVIAASCLSKWDEYVSGAVMTYYPGMVKKDYFDGTIQVPQYVICNAFNIKKKGELPPCRSCHNLFGLNTEETNEWPYGNCAEAESLSNLLNNEKEVKKETRVHPYSAKKRQDAEKEVRKELDNVLKTIQFKTWKGDYYSPE